VDIEALEALRPELERFAQDFDDCIKTQPSRKHFRRYMAGQLGDLGRKCVEPIALQAGIPPRNLQQFLSLHRWDDGAMVDCLQRRVARRHGHAEAIALIDETSFPKGYGTRSFPTAFVTTCASRASLLRRMSHAEEEAR